MKHRGVSDPPRLPPDYGPAPCARGSLTPRLLCPVVRMNGRRTRRRFDTVRGPALAGRSSRAAPRAGPDRDKEFVQVRLWRTRPRSCQVPRAVSTATPVPFVGRTIL